jgi:hypothetical protein
MDRGPETSPTEYATFTVLKINAIGVRDVSGQDDSRFSDNSFSVVIEKSRSRKTLHNSSKFRLSKGWNTTSFLPRSLQFIMHYHPTIRVV